MNETIHLSPFMCLTLKSRSCRIALWRIFRPCSKESLLLSFTVGVYNLNFRAKIMFFPSVFCQNNASKLEISDVCLHFQLFVYFFVSWLFTFCQLFVYFCQLFCLHFQLFVYIFSCLFTFLVSCLFIFSAICLHFQLFIYFWSADCLQFEFSRQKPCFFMTFLPLQMLQHLNCKLLFKIFGYLDIFGHFCNFSDFQIEFYQLLEFF